MEAEKYNINNANEKQAKALVIESMLLELNMSRQELIKLIESIMSQSISEEKEEGLTIDSETAETKNIDAISLADMIEAGDISLLTKSLTISQLRKLEIRIGLAFSLKKARELGVVIDITQISQLIGIPSVTHIMPDGRVMANNKAQHIPLEQSKQLTENITKLINQRQLAAPSLSPEKANQMAQITNDPNSYTNPNSTVNIVTKVISSIRMQMQNIGSAATNMLASGSAQNVASSQQAMAAKQNTVKTLAANAEKQFSNMKRANKAVTKMFPEVSKLTKKGADVFATVTTAKGPQEVKLSEYLKTSGKMNSKSAQAIDKFSASFTKLENALSEMAKVMPQAKAFKFDAAGRMQFTSKKDEKKTVTIVDHVKDLRREQKTRTRTETKKQDIQTKKTEATKEEAVQKSKEQTRGPQLDSAAEDARKATSQDAAIEQITLQTIKAEDPQEKTEKQEPKRIAEELIKLDSLNDRQKLMESLKSNTEMKEIESSMKDVMKNMKEAEKNKDLLDEMKKDVKGKQRDK